MINVNPYEKDRETYMERKQKGLDLRQYHVVVIDGGNYMTQDEAGECKRSKLLLSVSKK